MFARKFLLVTFLLILFGDHAHAMMRCTAPRMFRYTLPVLSAGWTRKPLVPQNPVPAAMHTDGDPSSEQPNDPHEIRKILPWWFLAAGIGYYLYSHDEDRAYCAEQLSESELKRCADKGWRFPSDVERTRYIKIRDTYNKELICACQSGDADWVARILEIGIVDVEYKEDYGRKTAFGCLIVIIYELKKEATLEKEGELERYKKCLALLLNYSKIGFNEFSIPLVDSTGREAWGFYNALDYYVIKGELDLVKMLLELTNRSLVLSPRLVNNGNYDIERWIKEGKIVVRPWGRSVYGGGGR